MFQRGYRALVLWIIWSAAAIISYAGMYHDSDVFTFIRNDPSRITWVILGLFLVGVLTSLILTVVVTLEAVSIDKLEIIAKRSGWLGIEHSNKKLSVARFFDALKTIVLNNGELFIESLVEVEFAVYRRTAHSLEVIGNLLITLGLVGTVVGLTLTLTGLTGSLEALGQDQELLMRGLRRAMSGMGTAFYTTLLGSILGGVLLRVYAHINENGIDSLENILTRICLVYCSADFKPSAERDASALTAEVENLSHKIQYLHTCLEQTRSLINDFGKELSDFNRRDDEANNLDNLLHKRKQYLDTLRDEFQLKRMVKGAWWRVFINSFRKE